MTNVERDNDKERLVGKGIPKGISPSCRNHSSSPSGVFIACVCVSHMQYFFIR